MAVRPAHATDSEPGVRRLPYIWAILRISLGWIFLWAFLDKLLGLGIATEKANAWIRGGSPTFGFLNFGSKGPFKEMFQAIAGDTWADWLFMLGLAGIGLSLLLGIAVRIGSWAGIAQLVLMWLAVLPPANNPFMDDHIIYAVILVALPWAKAGRTWGFGTWWSRLGIVQRYPFLE